MTAGKQTGGTKPFNRLVPVPPPKSFMDKIAEEEKKDSRPPLNKKIVIGRQGASTAMTQMGSTMSYGNNNSSQKH